MTRVTSRGEPLLSIGSGSVKVLKYSNYSVQFRFALCDFEKYGSVSVKVRKNSLKPVYKTPVRVRFDSLKKRFKKYLLNRYGHHLGLQIYSTFNCIFKY